jgi:hypothetical protein
MPRKEFESFTRLDASDVNTYLMDQSVMTFAGTAARGSAITTPVEGMVTYLEDSNTFQYWDSDSWDNLAPAAPSGNAIINGAFDIWQRGTSFTNINNTYSADRWVVARDGSTTVNLTQETFTPGAAPVTGYEGQFFARLTPTISGTSPFYMVQRIEDVRSFAGQTVTLSFWAKSSVNATNTPLTVQNFGAGGSSSVINTSLGTQNITTAWQRFSTTFTVGSAAGKTIGSNSLLEVQVIRSSSAATIDVWGVQLEAGTVSNDFRRNANSLQGELAACQRYYIRYTTAGGSSRIATGISTSTTNAASLFPLPVTMRISPSSIDFSSLAITNEVTYTNAVTALTLFTNAPQAIAVNATATGQTTNQAVHMVLQTNGFIGFSAEL